MSDPFVLGGVCYIDKDTTTAKTGQFAVVTEVAESGGASLVLCADKEDAQTLSSFYAAAPTASPTGDVAVVLGRSTRVQVETRRAAQALTSAGKWHGFFSAYVPFNTQGDGASATDEWAELRGKTFAATNLPVMEGSSFIGVHVGDVLIKSIDDDEPENPKASITFNYNGGVVEMTMPVAMLKKYLTVAAASTAGMREPVHPFSVPDAILGADILAILKALPISAKLDGGRLDGREMMSVARAALGKQYVAADEDAHDFTASAYANVVTLQALLTAASSSKGKAIKGKAWPNLNAERLGTEFRRFLSNAPAPPGSSSAPIDTGSAVEYEGGAANHARVNALSKIATNLAVFTDFLTASVEVTTPPDRHAMLKRSPYLASGALEQYLKRFGECASVDSIASKKSGTGLSSDELLGLIMHDIPGDGGITVDKGDSSAPRTPSAAHVFYLPSGTGTADERTAHRVLRADATTILGDPKLLKELESLDGLTKQPEMLTAAMGNVTHDALTRTCTSNEDVEKALQGALAAPSHGTRRAGWTRGGRGDWRDSPVHTMGGTMHSPVHTRAARCLSALAVERKALAPHARGAAVGLPCRSPQSGAKRDPWAPTSEALASHVASHEPLGSRALARGG